MSCCFETWLLLINSYWGSKSEKTCNIFNYQFYSGNICFHRQSQLEVYFAGDTFLMCCLLNMFEFQFERLCTVALRKTEMKLLEGSLVFACSFTTQAGCLPSLNSQSDDSKQLKVPVSCTQRLTDQNRILAWFAIITGPMCKIWWDLDGSDGRIHGMITWNIVQVFYTYRESGSVRTWSKYQWRKMNIQICFMQGLLADLFTEDLFS